MPPVDSHTESSHLVPSLTVHSNPAPYTPTVFAADCATSFAVGLCIAAPVTIIDYSIMMKVSGVSPSIMNGLRDGFKTLVLRPHHFFLRTPHNQYALIYRVVAAVYSLTYLSSNVAKDVLESRGYGGSEVNWSRGIVSGFVNTVLTIYKDSFILRNLPMASSGATASKFVPAMSRVGFCVRDVITCVAAFTLVPMFAQWLTVSYNGDAVPAVASNKTVSALSIPAVMQFITTALHIAAIRYQRTYPNPSWLDVKTSLQRDYFGSVAARIGRIVPAFGIGGIGNAALLDTTTRWAHDVDRKRRSLKNE